MQEARLPGSDCPNCSRPMSITVLETKDIPYFGEVLVFLERCESCNFRRNDVFAVARRGPLRYTYKVRGVKGLNVLLVRGSRCTVRIPELGIIIGPGPSSGGFITTVEGLLMRILEAAHAGLRHAENRADAERKLRELEDALQGKVKFTLVLEDPDGNSAVATRNAQKERL